MLDRAAVAQALAVRAITPDASQCSAIDAMLLLLAPRTSRWRRFLTPSRQPVGVYCYGPPGRGKSLVMDTIYALAPCTKRRIHFHEFLREVIRRQTVTLTGSVDSLVDNARAWLAGTELLCFDEFHVHDIADAFLIGRFLDTALAMGIRVVATSNYAPDELLPDPLFHERFVPTIERIKADFTVIHFQGERDYRFGAAAADIPCLLSPLDADVAQRLLGLYGQWEGSDAAVPQPVPVQAAGRTLLARAAGTRMVWIDFDDMCVASRSHLDYLELAQRWEAMIVDRLMVMRLQDAGTLQRLIWLVDILYDRRRMLCIASDQPLVAALGAMQGARDVSRTVSRLAEMQSRAYVLGQGRR